MHAIGLLCSVNLSMYCCLKKNRGDVFWFSLLFVCVCALRVLLLSFACCDVLNVFFLLFVWVCVFVSCCVWFCVCPLPNKNNKQRSKRNETHAQTHRKHTKQIHTQNTTHTMKRNTHTNHTKKRNNHYVSHFKCKHFDWSVLSTLACFDIFKAWFCISCFSMFS